MAEECRYYYYDSGYCCRIKRETEGSSFRWTVIRCIGTAGATIMMTVRGTEKRNTVNTRGMILSVIRRTTPQPVPPAIPRGAF